MGNPRETPVNQTQLVEIATLNCLPADMLPNQVHSSSTIEQYSTQSTYSSTKSSCHVLSLSGIRI